MKLELLNGVVKFQDATPMFSAYFIGEPKYRQRINASNQSSHFVENKVCALLTQERPLSKQDLILAMAWKIGGLIDNTNSEDTQEIIYEQNWPKTLTVRRYGPVNFSSSISYLANNIQCGYLQSSSEKNSEIGSISHLISLHLILDDFTTCCTIRMNFLPTYFDFRRLNRKTYSSR